MTINDLAEAIHLAYTSSPNVADRWQAAAHAALSALNGRPVVGEILTVHAGGEIVGLTPRSTTAIEPTPLPAVIPDTPPPSTCGNCGGVVDGEHACRFERADGA